MWNSQFRVDLEFIFGRFVNSFLASISWLLRNSFEIMLISMQSVIFPAVDCQLILNRIFGLSHHISLVSQDKYLRLVGRIDTKMGLRKQFANNRFTKRWKNNRATSVSEISGHLFDGFRFSPTISKFLILLLIGLP